MHSSIKKLPLIALLFVSFSSLSYSADIARTLRTNADENSAPENFLEMGVGTGLSVGSSLTDENGKGTNIGVTASASINWRGFFVDLLGETSELLVIGYNAYEYNNWSFDVVIGTTGNGITKDNDTTGRFEGLDKREGSSMLGGRATGYYGDNIIQLLLKHDVSGRSQGTVASALIGKNWQYRNWNFHGLLSLDLTDAKLADYFLGVSEEEANRTNFAAYDGKATLGIKTSIGVTYPISEHWVYRATFNFSSGFGLNDSPLLAKSRKFDTFISNSINYVF